MGAARGDAKDNRFRSGHFSGQQQRLTLMKTLGRIVLILAGFVLIALISIVVRFSLPGTPSSSRSMRFDGYILLPKNGNFSIYDYLSIVDRNIYVTAMSSGSVVRISLSGVGSTQFGEFKGEPAPHGVAVVRGQQLAFVTRSGKNVVDVFDPVRLQPITSIPVAPDPDAIIYDPEAKLVYVASADAKTATLIDPVVPAVAGIVRLPGIPEYPAVDSHTGLVYQNLADINALAAIDLAKRFVVGQWSLAGCERPTGLAIDPDSRRAFAACFGNARLVVFDLESHRVIVTLKTGRLTDSVAFDPSLHRIYTASADGTMTVIQQNSPDSYSPLETVSTHLLAHTLTVDPETHKVYVAYAALFARPRIAVFSPVR
ncbi:MAG: YncE family protein [Candidatus Acidiferrales bacterium]